MTSIQPTDTFTVTAYNVTTGTATVTFKVGAQTFTGVKVQGCPTDSVESVKRFFNDYVSAYLAGKDAEAAAVKVIDPSVAALVNVATTFN